MFDFHCHSLLSDGELLPVELIRRYQEKGYKAIAVTDHVDRSNIDTVIAGILKFCSSLPDKGSLKILPGIELTHLNLEDFGPLTDFARKKGIKVVVGHGETLVEPVVKGTNRAALEAGVDILAHPGLISESDVKLAAKKGIFLELTSRKGHCLTNGHIAKMAAKFKVKIALNNDSHLPPDIIAPSELVKVGLGAGLSQAQIDQIYRNLAIFLSKKLG
ncbi:MAG: histidinol phosphate phosphatase domain-containing protein [Candidatus Omnitrophota bacterium]